MSLLKDLIGKDPSEIDDDELVEFISSARALRANAIDPDVVIKAGRSHKTKASISKEEADAVGDALKHLI